jgi:tetratricopeptide (TPR) repeat protein
MEKQKTVLIIFTIVLIGAISAGCINNKVVYQPGITPTSTTAADLHMKGFDAYINGNFTTALDFYDQALDADPKYTRAWMDKGNVLIKLNRTSEAIAAYDAALALDNNLSLVWNSRGEALMALGRYSEALESFDKALQIAPEYARAKENRNLTQAKLK